MTTEQLRKAAQEWIDQSHSEKVLTLPRETVDAFSLIGFALASEIAARGDLFVVDQMVAANNDLIDRYELANG